MKRILFVLIALTTVPILALVTAQTDAKTILEKIVDNLRGGAMQGTLTFTVERPDRTTKYVLRVVEDGGERGLVRVLEPKREAGQAFLMDGDNLWIYNPTLKRSLRLPPSNRNERFLGSDVNYNDLSGRDLEKDYTVSVSKENPTLTLELEPKPGAPTPYGKVVLEADPKTLAPSTITYFDQRGNAVRRVQLSEYTPVGTRRVPTRTSIEDLTRPGYRTTSVMTEYQFGIKVPERCFTLEALERGC
jgi:outer membrane lipoprotein-sorting protein